MLIYAFRNLDSTFQKWHAKKTVTSNHQKLQVWRLLTKSSHFFQPTNPKNPPPKKIPIFFKNHSPQKHTDKRGGHIGTSRGTGTCDGCDGEDTALLQQERKVQKDVKIRKVQSATRWWFQRFFIFTSIWGDDPVWRACFSDGWFNHQLGKEAKEALEAGCCDLDSEKSDGIFHIGVVGFWGGCRVVCFFLLCIKGEVKYDG